MTKEQFKEKALEVIECQYQTQLSQINQIVERWDGRIEKYDDNYFLPKALYEAMFKRNTEHKDCYTYPRKFVIEYNKTVRDMFNLLTFLP